jgi:regulator of RNase E activity RraA
VEDSTYSLRGGWRARLGAAAAAPGLLVPYRHGIDGWFDFGPLQLDVPVWLWWWSRTTTDRALLDLARAGLPAQADLVAPFRDKEEAGHEAGWVAYLSGELPDYPERALEMALGQVSRRVAMMLGDDTDPDASHLHFWRRVNPVVTEVLTQLVGGPRMLYNGGLPFTALRYEDVDRARPGLPATWRRSCTASTTRASGCAWSTPPSCTPAPCGSAAAASAPTGSCASPRPRRLGGVPGASGSYRAPANPARTTTWSCDDDLVVTLSPAHAADLDLIIARGAERPACTLPEETHERRPDPPRFRPARARRRLRPPAPRPHRRLRRRLLGHRVRQAARPGHPAQLHRRPRAADGRQPRGRIRPHPAVHAATRGHGIRAGAGVRRAAHALWHVLEAVQPGDVLVIQAYGSRFSGCIGDILARYFARKGGAGIVVDGRIRDAGRIRELGIPVWSTGTTPHYASQSELVPWAYDVPVAVGGALCMPGDLVVADDDGPVVVPQAMARQVIDSARDHEEWEVFSRTRLDEGARLSDYPLTPDTREEYEAWRSVQSSVR